MSNPSDNAKEIREQLIAIFDAPLALEDIEAAEKYGYSERLADQIVVLITAHEAKLHKDLKRNLLKEVGSKLPKKYRRFGHPERIGSEQLIAGFNNCLDLVNQALKEIEREIK